MHTKAKESHGHRTIYLMPGEVFFGHEPASVVTILGSCVSIAMFDRNLRTGAICHAMMPSTHGFEGEHPPANHKFRYVDLSIEWMLSQFGLIGSLKMDIEVSILGGSKILSNRNESTVCVGMKNIETALRSVRKLGLFIKSVNVSGNMGRRVVFRTDTGEVSTVFLDKTIAHLITSSQAVCR